MISAPDDVPTLRSDTSILVELYGVLYSSSPALYPAPRLYWPASEILSVRKNSAPKLRLAKSEYDEVVRSFVYIIPR